MVPPEHSEHFNTDPTPIRFENLEERLLLTTLNAGDFFIYHNSQDQNVRVDLIGNPGDSVELMTAWTSDDDLDDGILDILYTEPAYPANYYEDYVEVMDLPGLLNPVLDNVEHWLTDGTVVNWPAGNVFMPYETEGGGFGIMEADPDILDADPDTGEIKGWAVWNTTFTEGDPLAEPPTLDQLPIRGAMAEIFAIWINQCSFDTRLVISVLEESEPYSEEEEEDFFTNLATWDSPKEYLLAYDEDNEEVYPLDDVGGVIVGARPDPAKDDPEQEMPAYIATSMSLQSIPTGQSIPSGITVDDGTANLWRWPSGLYVVSPGPGYSPQDMGRIIIGGTVSGRIQNSGSIDIIEMGFLWGNVDVGHNLNYILMRRGGGGVNIELDPTDYDTDDIIIPDNDSLISVGGCLGMVMVDSLQIDAEDLFSWSLDTPLYTAIEVHNDLTIALPSTDIYEHEFKAVDYDDEEEVEGWWILGELVDINNDIVERAEILTHPTGTFTLHGGAGWDYMIGGESQDSTDWFALPLMAGQTIVISGGANDSVLLYGPGDGLNPHADDPDEDFVWYQMPTDPSLRLMATYGNETIEDWGYHGNEEEHIKPLTFTAPTAGVYYLSISGAGEEGEIHQQWGYDITFQNATHAAFGGVNLIGNYFGNKNFSTLGTGDYGGGCNMTVDNGGGLGAVIIHGNAFWTWVRTIRGGDIVSFEAETVGAEFEDTIHHCRIISESNIGRVASTVGWINAIIEAGAGAFDGSYPRGYYNNDAYIQNVYSASTWGHHTNSSQFIPDLWATGSIGVIDITGNVNYLSANEWGHHEFEIRANSDGVGPSATIDLIYVGGDWRGVHLFHGPGGDIGYVYVGGDIWVSVGSWGFTDAEEHVVTDGSTSVLNDDGGGKLTIKPKLQYDSFGQEILDAEGIPMYYEYGFIYIPVDDYMGGGIGGVIANLRIEGSVDMTATGRVQISNIDITGVDVVGEVGDGDDDDDDDDDQDQQQPLPGEPEDVIGDTIIKISGSGAVDIYYLDGDDNPSISFEDETPEDSVDIDSFINQTPGRLVSASLGSAQTIELAGDLGPVGGHTGAWIFGRDVAPIMNVGWDIEDPHVRNQPQYGWFNGRVHGINIYRDLDELRVDGFIHDVRVKGTLGIVQANADHWTDPGIWDDWDGISGLIWSQTRIDYVDVGDGLADDGTSVVAEAAIMSTLSIGTVYISGQRYEKNPPLVGGDPNDTLKPAKVFGEINGSIIGRNNDVLQIRRIVVLRDVHGYPIRILSDTMVQRQVDAIGDVIGEGSTLTARVMGGCLASFQTMRGAGDGAGYWVFSTVGNVEFTGATAEIYGAHIWGVNVREVITSTNSQGISHTEISGWAAPADEYGVGEVVVGGPGISDCRIRSDGGSIGDIKAVGSSAGIQDSLIASTDSLKSISARYFHNNSYHMAGTIGSVTSTNCITSELYNVGAIGKITTGGNFNFNHLNIAREISSLDVKLSFNSTIIMQGPSVGYLKSLTVTGNIAGTIESYGHIGSIVSRNGNISADISTHCDEWNADVKLIQTALGFTGHLDVAGSVEKFISNSSLGDNPAVHGTTQVLDIFGDLDYLCVKGSKSDLFATINVGGDIGNIDVEGDLYADIIANGNLDRMTVDGKLGGDPGDGIDRGSITVFGSLKSLRFNKSEDLVANITVGDSIKKLSTSGGNIKGNITSLYGSIDGISVRDADILGNLTALSIGKVSVSDGDIEGNILATNGDIDSVSIRNGNLEGNLTAENGSIDKVSINNGDAADSSTIYGYAGIGKISITGGDLDADVISGRGIGTISVKKSNLTGMVNAETGIDKIDIGGTISNTIRSGGKIKSLTAGSLNSAIISSAWDIEKIKIKGNVTNSLILSGYDVGADGALAGGDDNLLNGGQVHSGNIKSIAIDGKLLSSVVAAGVSPGVDNNFLTLVDNEDASGVSNIKKMTVKGGFDEPLDQNGILAETSIDSKLEIPIDVVVYSGPSSELEGIGIDFGPDSPNPVKTLTTPDGLTTLTLSSGWANYDNATGDLVLRKTNSKSSLTLKYTGAGNKNIVIISSDDSGLSSLKMSGNIILGNVSIDGYVKTLQANVADGATWILPGGVGSAKIGAALANVNITAGQIDKLDIKGDYFSASGTDVLTADAIKSLSVNGQMSADLTTILGDASKIDIKGGNLSGDLSIRGSTKSLSVSGALTGDVSVTNGDLSTVKANSLSGLVNVERGDTKSITVSSGSFSGSYRALGIKTFKVSKANFTGLLGVQGDIDKLDVKGTMSGRVWSGGNIKNMSAGSLNGALVAASGDLTRVNINGNMTDSYIFAGFNPGDAGYDDVTAEQGNIAIDAFDVPLSSEQVDQGFAGTIKSVTIKGMMNRSTISAGVAPGQDGYVGTDDDTIAGSGYIDKVRVSNGIHGDGDINKSYGIYAANNMPTVTSYRQPFLQSSNAYVRDLSSWAGPLAVTSFKAYFNSIEVIFNHPLDFSKIGESTFELIVSTDGTFAAPPDHVITFGTPGDDADIIYDIDDYVITLTLNANTWTTLGYGNNYQLTIDANIVRDIRGNTLEQPYVITGTFD